MSRQPDLPTAPLLKVADVAQLASVSPRTIWGEYTAGALRATRIGRAIRFRPEDVAAWLERRRERAR